MTGALSPEIGYRWESPPQPRRPDIAHLWSIGKLDPVSRTVNELDLAQWRIAHLRELIAPIGDQPEGATRHQVTRHLAELFLDRERLSNAVHSLSDEELRYYVTLILQTHLHYRNARPLGKKLWEGFTTDWPKLARRIRKVSLALETEAGDLYLPVGLRRSLPPISLPFASCQAPRQVVAADSLQILTQVQQLLILLQSESWKLRDRLRWQAPTYQFAQQITCWPIIPADAQRLNSHVDMDGAIELLPPDPAPTDGALAAWAEALGCSEERAEFLYALLETGGIVLQGSPITVDSALAQQWLSLPPGRQVGVLYQLWRDTESWAEWWTQWRGEQVRVKRLYHGYWGLSSIDRSVKDVVRYLREVILELLSALPQNQWLATRDLLKWIAALFPTPDTQQYLLGLNPQGPKGGWLDFLELVLLSILTGPLLALGLVELGPGLEDVKAIRLRDLQDLQWERREEVSLDAIVGMSQKAIRFSPGESILEIETPIPPPFLAFVLQWATPAGFSRTLARYRLNVKMLHRAFEQGLDPEALRAAWTATSGLEPLPSIDEWWEMWWQRYGHVRLYPAQALLQTRDAFTMQELQASLPHLQASSLGALTPKALLLDEGSVDDLLSDLTRQGYMPKEV